VSGPARSAGAIEVDAEHRSPDLFTFRDGERAFRFGRGVLSEAPTLLGENGFGEYVLYTTPRAESVAPDVVSGATRVAHVPPGPVPEAAAAVREEARGLPIVSLGGGRVVDAAKAVAGADGLRTAAIPTTLAGSPFTGIHRMPAGVDEWRLVRPALVVADPELMGSPPERQLAATAMNALAHASEALYSSGANPVSEGAALRAAELFAHGLAPGELDREALSLGALLGGYAIGTTGLGIHHALCQTIVRTAGTPHAETNAVVLPHSLRHMAQRAPRELTLLARALGRPLGAPDEAAEAVAVLAARAGPATLGELGLDAGSLPAIRDAALEHPAFGATAATPDEVDSLLRGAL
jgi:maleylacetate reductase